MRIYIIKNQIDILNKIISIFNDIKFDNYDKKTKNNEL